MIERGALFFFGAMLLRVIVHKKGRCFQHAERIDLFSHASKKLLVSLIVLFCKDHEDCSIHKLQVLYRLQQVQM